MRSLLSLLAVVMVLAVAVSCGTGAGPARQPAAFDEYGLNEVAGIFDGSYFNNYCGRPEFGSLPPYQGDDAAYLAANGPVSSWNGYLQGIWQYRSTRVLMKWNKAWPNQDGWITNHMWDSYSVDGVEYSWDYFVKIVWVGAKPSGTDPYAGQRIWGDFAVIQEVYNDTGSGDHGNIPYPGPNGFGAY